MTREELFNAASNTYNEAINLIQELGVIANQGDNEKKYDIDIMKKQFDVLIQSLLLEVACSDLKISRTEAEFIDKITTRVDILDDLHIKFSDGEIITWDTITKLVPSDYDSLCKQINAETEYPINDLINLLGIVDAITKINYFEKFNEYIAKIIVALCYIDGDFNENQELIAKIVGDKYFQRWQFILDKAKELYE